jgi:glutathione S-transferase
MTQLFYTPGTISVAVAIALHEAGLPFEPVLVDFATAEQTKPAYHAINPKGRVPALATDQGILTETGAVLDYVAACAPQAGLVPDDAFAAAKMREMMYYLASTVHVNHAHKMRGSRWATEDSSLTDMTSKVKGNMQDCAAHIEANGIQGPYVLGQQFSLADPYLFVVTTWMPGDGVDLAAYPKLARHFELVSNRASVQAVRDQGMLGKR